MHIRVCILFSCNQPAEDLVRECEEKAVKRLRDTSVVNRPENSSKALARNLVGMKSTPPADETM